MFGRKTGRNKLVTATTKKELEAAVKAGTPCIEIKGGLAQKLKWMRKLKPAAVAALLPLLLAAPAASAFAASAVLPASVAAVGITAHDISICMISASVLFAVLKNYSIEAGPDYIRLTKK